MTTAFAPTSHYTDGDVSFWYRELGIPEQRPALDGDTQVDVAIVGAGFTGLWTAYYLIRADPSLRIAVVEREFAGFGASGRNGGWITAEPVGQLERYARTRGPAAAIALQRAMFASVKEVVAAAAREGIEADIVSHGKLDVALNPAQLDRLRKSLAIERRCGWGEEDLVMLTAREVQDRIRVAGVLGGTWTPHCARVQPAKLVRGLAAVAENLGVRIYEGTTCTAVHPGHVVTDHGTVRADVVVRALEGFTASLPGLRRQWLPMFSNMIATEPLPASVWESIGWQGAELLGDQAHAFTYAQRTADGRIALGGRAVPYFYGSRWDAQGETAGDSVAQLRAGLLRRFPQAAGSVGIDHSWAGILGVPRDWCGSAGLDPKTGMAWAGGYVGHGVAGSNLAGRTLRDLILRRKTALTRLPWVGRRVRKWEPEPLRWLAVRGLYTAYRLADRHEDASGRTTSSPIAQLADAITGK